ncbi:MAG: tetratricopeptide repeat protein [bacterium]
MRKVLPILTVAFLLSALGCNPSHERLGDRYASSNNPKDWPKAVEEYKAALEENPNDPMIMGKLALVSKRLGRKLMEQSIFGNDVVNLLETAVEMMPTDHEAHFYLGMAYENRGRANPEYLDKAVEEFQIALKLRPEPRYYYGLGMTYYFQGKVEMAIEALNKAVDLDEGYVDAYAALGRFYYEVGKYENAITNYGEAIIRSDYRRDAQRISDFHANIGMIYETIGNSGKAIESWRRALEIYPGNQEARSHLEEHGVKP